MCVQIIITFLSENEIAFFSFHCFSMCIALVYIVVTYTQFRSLPIHHHRLNIFYKHHTLYTHGVNISEQCTIPYKTKKKKNNHLLRMKKKSVLNFISFLSFLNRYSFTWIICINILHIYRKTRLIFTHERWAIKFCIRSTYTIPILYIRKKVYELCMYLFDAKIHISKIEYG